MKALVEMAALCLVPLVAIRLLRGSRSCRCHRPSYWPMLAGLATVAIALMASHR